MRRARDGQDWTREERSDIAAGRARMVDGHPAQIFDAYRDLAFSVERVNRSAWPSEGQR